MDSIRQYLLSVICAAIVCSLINHMADKNGAQNAILRLLTGIFMSVTLISPFKSFDLSNITSIDLTLSQEAQQAVLYGQKEANNSLSALIKSETESYILDKAASLNVELTVEVTLNGSNPPGPESVVLMGPVSPYAKSMLSAYIADDLGIPEDKQQWM